jgi:ribonucleoside-triphosphate reductase (thioredoxin)
MSNGSMIIDLDKADRFTLDPIVKMVYQSKPTEFGYGLLGEAVYARTYSRIMDDGRQEKWSDTVLRVVEGTLTIRKWFYVRNRLKWDEEYWQKIGADMVDAIFNFRLLTAGRHLWSSGTETVDRFGSQALSNCSFVEVVKLSRDASWGMNVLMLGSGLGASTYSLQGNFERPRDEVEVYEIPDSRQGWVESVRRLIASYEEGSNRVQFDYDLIRPYGSPIGGFGGTASGPDPLRQLHERIRTYLDDHVNGKTSRTRLIADVINAIGACVVAGNVRRSAQILLGAASDDEFRELKNYEKNPERAEIGWLSNNTVVLTSDNDYDDYSVIPDIAESIVTRGEPGVLSKHVMQKYGRFGDVMPDTATGTNPCAEIALESYENCVIADVAVPRCVDKFGNFDPEVFYKTLRLATLVTSSTVLVPTESEETNAVISRNRRIGVSLTGIANWWAVNPTSKVISWLNRGYDVVREENARLAREAGVPASIRVTTVKPSGTVSLLAGVSSGIHLPFATRYIRRVRVSESAPITPLLEAAGVPLEPDLFSSGTLVASFPVDEGKVKGQKDVSVWEKASHVKLLQKFWADNAVSVTLTYNKEKEGPQMENLLAQTLPFVKTLSALPIDEETYQQAPIEETTLEKVNEMKKQIRPIDWNTFGGSDGNALTDAYCSNDSCSI